MQKYTAKEALEAIAGMKLPCTECEAPHEFRVYADAGVNRGVGTWASPNDGHPYRRMIVENFAKRVLKELGEEPNG